MVYEGTGGGGGAMRKVYLVINTLMLSLGTGGGPLLMRLYFIHGGKRVWLSSWLETSGWPVMFIPLAINYFHRRSIEGPAARVILMNPFVFVMMVVIGILTGLDDYFYAYGVARLPVSTSALIIATQLGFTAAFAFLLVRQKFTSYSINAVFLLTIGAGVLAMHMSGDRPAGESNKQYYMGFFMTLGAAALYGFILPLIELTYKKAKQSISYSLGGSVSDVLLRHSVLHNWHDRQQGFPGDAERSKGLWAWRSELLDGDCVERHNLAVLLLGGGWSHTLLVLPILGDSHSCPLAGDRDPGRLNLQGEVPGREGGLYGTVPLGFRLLLLRGD